MFSAAFDIWEEVNKGNMTIWHVQKLYTSAGTTYEVLSYDLLATIQYTLKMEKGIRQAMKFLANSCLTEKGAYLLLEKKNNGLI